MSRLNFVETFSPILASTDDMQLERQDSVRSRMTLDAQGKKRIIVDDVKKSPMNVSASGKSF